VSRGELLPNRSGLCADSSSFAGLWQTWATGWCTATAEALPETYVWNKLEHAGIFAGLAATGLLAFPKRGLGGWLALSLITFVSACEICRC
jgi:hypothetical protein